MWPHVALGIGDNVALAALDLLACIKAMRAAAFRRLHRLAVDDAGGRAGLAAGALARIHHRRMVDAHEQSVARPFIEITLHGRIGRKILRQLTPLTVRRHHVQDRVHHHRQVRRS